MKKLSATQLLTLLFPLQIVCIKVISYFPQTIERYYSNGLFLYLSSFLRQIFGWIPFSIGDMMYTVLGIGFLTFSFRLIKSENKTSMLYQFGASLSILFFLFQLLWGLNYHRQSLFTTLHLTQKKYTKTDITQLIDALLIQLKESQLQLVANDTIAVHIPYSKQQILNRTPLGFLPLSILEKTYSYKHPSLKKSLFSIPLTYMGFSGYYNPLSGEAQVDVLLPKISLPITSSHEVAHQLGFASESETNFIGFLATSKHPDAYFNYSGYLMAIRYSISALAVKDSMAAKTYFLKLPKGIQKNIKQSDNFWKSYHNKAAPYFKLFYDTYLKANKQKAGIKSYSKMVNLLVAYHKKYGV